MISPDFRGTEHIPILEKYQQYVVTNHGNTTPSFLILYDRRFTVEGFRRGFHKTEQVKK
jgi:hypothetical protein